MTTFDSDDKLTGGHWETTNGGVKVWVPTDEPVPYRIPEQAPRNTTRNQLPPKKGHRPVLKRTICTECGALVIGDETCFCQPERK